VRRYGIVGVVGVLLLSVLAGCSPAIRGVGAVRLDDGHGLVGVFGLCKGFGELSTITLYAYNADGALGDEVIDLARVGPAPAGHVVEVPLQAPPPQWHARKMAAQLAPDQTYELRAWNTNGGARVESFPFRIAELRDRADRAKSLLTKTYTGSAKGVDQYHSTFSTPEGFGGLVDQRCAASQ
jgi:hypothetical protein